VDFEFANRKMERLYTEEKGARRYPPRVVDAFFRVMRVIESAADERDLRRMKHLHFERLEGGRKHQRSLALHGGFRLVVQLREDDGGKFLLIDEIVDYHKG
jgi:proteic killer suppression protein